MMRFMKPSKSGTVKAVSPCDGPGHRPAFWAGFVFLGLLRQNQRRESPPWRRKRRFEAICINVRRANGEPC